MANAQQGLVRGCSTDGLLQGGGQAGGLSSLHSELDHTGPSLCNLELQVEHQCSRLWIKDQWNGRNTYSKEGA